MKTIDSAPAVVRRAAPQADWRRAREALGAGAVVVGVDEVGRGPLAGDVVAGAVVFEAGAVPPGLDDSKKLSASRREHMARAIEASGAHRALGRATPAEIDALNILRASLLAMQRAVEGLGLVPDLVLVDGRHLPDWSWSSVAVIRGDSQVAEIAAASIIAKVARDGDMDRLNERWPVYGFDRHRGYPTAAHLAALREHGPIPEHRRSFAPVRALLEGRS